MIYVFYFGDEGAPKTGLSPTLDIFVKESDGTSAGTPPTPSELSGGFYKFTYAPSYNVVVRIDSNDATMADADRYIPLVASPHDDDLDRAVSTVYDRIGAPAGASIAADLVVIDNFVDELESRLTAARAGYLDELAAANLPADMDLILADTGELQTDWANGGRLDLLLDAIPTTAMRGTDGANTTVPDAAGVAPTAAEIKTAIEAAGSSLALILADTGTDGVVVASGSKSGYTLLATGADLIEKDSTFALAIADAIWDEPQADHVAAGSFGEAVTDLLNESNGRWRITENQMIFYEGDNITEVMRFNLFDADGNPAMQNVYERRRV